MKVLDSLVFVVGLATTTLFVGSPLVAQDGCGQFECPTSGNGPCSGVVVEITDINCDTERCLISVEVSNPNGPATAKQFRRDPSGNVTITLCNAANPPCCVHIQPCVDWADTDSNCCIVKECE